MNTASQLILNTANQVRGWSWLKKTYALVFGLGFLISSFLFLTPPGSSVREWLAQTVITTQHRDWAWIFVGKEKRDEMIAQLILDRDRMGSERQIFGMIKNSNRKLSADQLIKIEDISAQFWKGKKMYVYDPRAIRVVVPEKPGEGERVSSMIERTGAIAGINGGGFVDPDGLGNGFAPIGFIMSGGKLLYTDQDGSIPQFVVGFTKEGTLVVGKYTIDELTKLGVSEAVMFYPRVIANGKPLITSGDGGWGRGPRTAIGQKEDGTIIIMVIDGRQTHSVGATLKEVQDLMLEEGVVNAGFLDGGASSELVTKKDGVITKPSSRYGERRLPSAMLIFEDPSKYKANNPWEGITHIDPGGAYDHPGFKQEQEELRRKGLLKPSPVPQSTRSPEPAHSPAPTSKPKETANPESTANSGGGATAPPPAAATEGPGKGSAGGGGAPTATPAQATPKPAQSPAPQQTQSGSTKAGGAGQSSAQPGQGTNTQKP